MRKISERDILKICYLYYNEEKTQEEISSLFGVTRFKISRILKEARKNGHVSIIINNPMVYLTKTEVKLEKNFGLKESVVIRINEFSGKSALEQIGEAGAQYVNRIIEKYKVMGVAWGRTLRQVVNHVKEIEAKHLTVAQISGGMGTIEGTDANMLTMMLSQKLGGKAFLLQSPAVVRDRPTRDTLLKERKIIETLAIARTADLALLGIGLINRNGLLWKAGLLETSDYNILKQAGVVGAICGRCYDINGKPSLTDWNNRVIGLTLDELRKIEHKVGIVIGQEKVDGILGALRGKFLNVLITDENTAKTLLSQL